MCSLHIVFLLHLLFHDNSVALLRVLVGRGILAAVLLALPVLPLVSVIFFVAGFLNGKQCTFDSHNYNTFDGNDHGGKRHTSTADHFTNMSLLGVSHPRVSLRVGEPLGDHTTA